ncbi:phage lytic cycle repressor MrpR family protein, partial [Bacillus pumilus]
LFRKVYNFSKIEELNPQVIFKTKRKKVGEMFNQEFKEEFLESKLKTEEYAVSTADTVRILFNKTAKLEKEYNKDIYEMTADELDEAMRSLKAKSVRSLQNYASKIRHYIDFAVGKGLAKENLASRYRTKKDVQDLIDKDFIENMIFDKEEIMEMAEYADNAQDGVIIALTFDGLSYRDKYTELV